MGIGEEYRLLVEGCTKKRREECEKKAGPYLDEMCASCELSESRDRRPGPYLSYLLRVRRMRLAGYPLRPRDLTYREWLDLGELEETIEAMRPRLF